MGGLVKALHKLKGNIESIYAINLTKKERWSSTLADSSTNSSYLVGIPMLLVGNCRSSTTDKVEIHRGIITDARKCY